MKKSQDKHIEKRLFVASKQMIPEDMYDRITQSIAQGERTISMNTTTTTPITRNRHPMRWLTVAAAACVLLICGIFGGNYYINNLMVDSIVDIDVNPGIEISTNKNDVVLDVIAINSDAERVLDNMNLKNTELKVAVNAIIGSMVRNGYLIDGENSILVTVQNNDEQRATHIRNLILSDIDASLRNNNITASVVNQTVADSADAKDFSTSQGISFGKAAFILNLCTKDSSLDRTVLSKMNMRELVALIVERDIDIRDIVDYDADDSIWENIEDASFIRAELDRDDGREIYDIELTADGIEYDYEINAQTEEIISFDKDIVNDNSGSTNDTPPVIPVSPAQPEVITPDSAKQIALSHAGVSTDAAAFIKVELDKEAGVQIYEVEFCVSAIEYDYEIDALTGNILRYESEIDD